MRRDKKIDTNILQYIFGTSQHGRWGTLALTAIIGMGVSMAALAGSNITPRTHHGHKPKVIKAANGTPVVNIVAPNKRGLSHNVYSKFNVKHKGLILNNSATVSKTQLAGYIYGNAKLDKSGSAQIILNEVTSTNRSSLNGYMEVAGTPAAVIVANPNGITCDGCGFINTPRAVLTTGQPLIGVDGRLNGFRVTKGNISIAGAGLDASHIDRIDLLSRAIKVNAKLWAKKLNAVAGANNINYSDLSATPIAGEGTTSTFSIDVSALGGMYANAIHLVGTEAGVGVNIQGEVAAQAGDFTLTSNGKIIVGGKSTATGAATLHSSQNIDVAGTVAAGDKTSITGNDINVEGAVYSGNAIHLAADGDITNQGTLNAHGGNLTVEANGQVNNTGTAYSAGNSQWQAGGVLTNTGTVESGPNGNVSMTAASLTNAGHIQAGRNLDITTTTGDADNQNGTVQAMGSLTLTSADALNNTAGTIQAGSGNDHATMSIQADSLDNHNGRLVNADQGNTTLTITHTVNNQGGTLGGEGDVKLSADSADNSHKGKLVAGQNLTLVLNQLNNTNGTVYAGSNLAWATHGASLINESGGTLGAGNNLTLTLSDIHNAAGQINAGQNINLTLNSLDGAGDVLAGDNLNITLSDDYTNVSGSTLKANNDLSFTTSGDFDNRAGGTLQAVKKLTVNAVNIRNENADKGAFDSTTTKLVASHNLTNSGRIEGDTVNLDVTDNVSNTGTIIGGAITVNASNLTNGADLGTKTGSKSHYGTGLIAATNSLDLFISGKLLNRDATLFTLGEMTLAANAKDGRSDSIVNLSGDIEADDDITIDADVVKNKRRYVSIKKSDVPNSRKETMPAPPTEPSGPGETITYYVPINQKTDTSVVDPSHAAAVVTQCNAFGDHWKCKKNSADKLIIHQTDTFRIVQKTVVSAASAQSRIWGGGNGVVNGSLVNKNSSIAIGGNFLFNSEKVSGALASALSKTDVKKSHHTSIGSQYLKNSASGATLKISHMRKQWAEAEYHEKCLGGLDRCWKDKPESNPTVTNTTYKTVGNKPAWDGAAIDLGLPLTSTIKVNGTVAINDHDTKNITVDANGDPINATSLGKNTIATNLSSHIFLPHSGLYTINSQPGSHYLVETDPRFANYAQFVSSDYLLGKLGYKPAQVGKRLGDGFYEQRQVLDQITELTGRRFLENNTSAMAQYRALMNNAVAADSQFDLSVGVALTADQMANLTHNIVWLVKKQVDGQSVLVPVVYLSPNDAQQLEQSGAVIAGRNVVMNSAGAITNSGNIIATQNLSLKADSLLNSGTLAADDTLGAQIAHDILNVGGTIKGGNVSLKAGGDLISRSLLNPVEPGSIDIANITATHGLDLHADHDIDLDAAQVKAGDDLNLTAGHDIHLNALATTTHGGDSHSGHTTLTHHLTQLTSGGNMTLVAGHDLTSQAAHLKADKTLNITAGHDIQLAAVKDNKKTLSIWQHGATSGVTTTNDDTLHATQLTGTQGIHLNAGHDVTLVATQMTSQQIAPHLIQTHHSLTQGTAPHATAPQGNITITAGHNINIKAGHEEHKQTIATRTHHSSLFSSSTKTTHDVIDNTLAIGAQIKGQNITFKAGHDLTTEGSEVQAAKALNVTAGHDIQLKAVHNVYRHKHHEHKTHTHFGAGFLVGLGNGQIYTKTNDDTQGTQTVSLATGTLLSGDTVNVTANHDLTTQGAQLVATHDIALSAGHDLHITTAVNTHTQTHGHIHRVDGWQHSGIVQMVGETETRQKLKVSRLQHIASLIGSTKGHISLTAGHNVHITGSNLLSQTGTDITGQNITIDAALDTTDTHHQYGMHKAGVTAGIGGVIGSLANSAVHLYQNNQRHSHLKDKRLKALYAAQTAYQLYDMYGQANNFANHGPGKSNSLGGSGINVQIALGDSTAHSHSDTHDETTYGSHIRSQGNITIHATKGDINITGSQLKGQDIALTAAHDIHLIGQTEHHTQTHKGSNAGGKIGVSIGSTTGFFLSLSAGGAKAHGNGTTHQITDIDANGTLTLNAGHDATLNGAQAKGNQILADIGHDLNLKSQQDTGDFASHSWQAGVTIVYNGGVSVSAHAAFSGMNKHYKSVKKVTGLAAGQGGYNLYVGNNTDLTGAVIASSADPTKNRLDTGSLSYSDLKNIAKYKSYSISVGGGTGAGGMSGGITGGIGLPQHHHQSSTTQAGIAQGTIITRNGPTDLTGLNRTADINQKGLKRKFNRKKLKHNQKVAQLAGYVSMRTVGAISEYEQNQAYKDYTTAQLNGNTKKAKEEHAKLQRWSDGGTNKVILHGIAGALTASLGGGNALNGALGASTSEAVSGELQQTLADHGINPDQGTGKGLMELASTVIGGAAGGGQGAMTALQGEKYNRQLHENEVRWIKQKAEQFAKQQCSCDHPSDKQIGQAKTELAQQAARHVDLLWTAYIPEDKQTQATQTFLSGATDTFTNEKGQQQKLFTTEGNQYALPSLGTNSASLRFYKKNIQPGATRSVSTYLKAKGLQQLKSTSTHLKQSWAYTTHHPGDDFINTIKGDWYALNGALTSLREGAWQLVRHPINSGKRIGHGLTHSFKEGGTTWGVTAATWSGRGQTRLNALYGQNITAAQRTLQGLQSTDVLAGAVVGGKGLAQAGEAVGLESTIEGGVKATGRYVSEHGRETGQVCLLGFCLFTTNHSGLRVPTIEDVNTQRQLEEMRQSIRSDGEIRIRKTTLPKHRGGKDGD